jgi:formylglycine-generating enzyme required for sulfatase activity
MINFQAIEELIEAARAVLDQEPDALLHLQAALEGIDEAEEDSRANAQMIDTARDEFVAGSSDDIEIDDQPLVDIEDEGVWVNAWVWVADPAFIG